MNNKPTSDVSGEHDETVSPSQDRKARDIEQYIAKFPARFMSKWPDLGVTGTKKANIADAFNNTLLNVLSHSFREGQLFSTAYQDWHTGQENYHKCITDGRMERAKAIMAAKPAPGGPAPKDLDAFIKGLDEKMFAMIDDIAKGGVKKRKTNVGTTMKPGMGGR